MAQTNAHWPLHVLLTIRCLSLILHHNPLAAADLNLKDVITLGPVPDDLICPADDIIDRRALRRSLTEAVKLAKPLGSAQRLAVVPVLKDAMKRGSDKIAAAFTAAPFDAGNTTRAYAWLTDSIVIEVFNFAQT
ncbi:MAG: hypothetical protein ACSHW1_20445, partial [Yoonia sp.]